jgi:hypothetical protein
MAQNDAIKSVIGRYPFGFWFDGLTGEFVELWEIYQEIVEKSLQYSRYVDGQRRSVVRVEPWEI